MEKNMGAMESLEFKPLETYDFADPVEMVKAIDLAMRQYFGAADWPSIRNKLLPGLQPKS